ncbi:MAG: hypothetical protein PHF24_07550 [Syntrophomonas sp.]|nr:hypothetical protein [Syntrophomonas sp.]
MNEANGNQFSCNESSCKHCKDNQCDLTEVFAYYNVNSGLAEGETRCSDYEEREDTSIGKIRSIHHMNRID